MVEPTKNDLVLLLIKKASEKKEVEIPGIMGKKALQKCMYFFNEKFNFFTFKWRDFGPLSAEIQQMAQDFISNENVIVHDIPTKKEGAFIRNMTFNEKHNYFFDDIEFSKEIDEKLNQIVQFASGKKPRELELLASVHYWAKKQQFLQDEYTVEYIHDKLTELKPDAGFNSKDVQDAISTLESNNYLNPELDE